MADRREALGGMKTVEGLQGDYPQSFSYGFAPSAKASRWHPLAIPLRLCLDYWRYLEPHYDNAHALRARASRQVPAFSLRLAPFAPVLRPLARMLERAVPPGPQTFRIFDEHMPDLLMVTPLLYFGSQQVDYVRAARQRGLPTVLCVGSWDHLTTKGLIHEIPDGVIVWNEAQKREAAELHGVPPSRVAVTGAQAYDHWFRATPTLSREEFCARVGLPSNQPYLLYLCSSPFIAPREVAFVRSWMAALRASGDPALAAVGVLIRPHPQNAQQWDGVDVGGGGDAVVFPRAGANPVDLHARADYFHSMYHSAAVVGINTSALIESGIVGRPVFSVRTSEFAGTQEGTLHFQHLKTVNGGLLRTADTLEEHVDHLKELLAAPALFQDRGRGFIEAFIRPHGLDRPAGPLMADAVEDVARSSARQAVRPTPGQQLLRPLLWILAVAAQRLRQKRPVTVANAEGTSPAGVRRVLFAMQSAEYLRFYDDTLLALAEQGHEVVIAVNAQRDVKQARVDGLTAQHPNVHFAGLVPRRRDMWAVFVRAIRGTMDFVRYLDPRFAGTSALRARMKRKALPRALGWFDRLDFVGTRGVAGALGALRALERAVPVSREVTAFLEQHRPHAVVVTPLVDASSPQVDLIRAAQSLGIPNAVCIASWDNLTNKGLLRVVPDLVTVWNPIQAREAIEFHGVPAERITVTGAQPFDRWFVRTPSRTRDELCGMLGFDATKPIVLFTGSSFFISGEHAEVPFVRKWLSHLRDQGGPLLRDANVLIRPHPYNADQWSLADVSDVSRVAVWPKARHNPTDEQNRSDYFDSLYHADAVVGINTSAMIEAAILGRAVHSILVDDYAATQEGTIHFRYLLADNGGFLRVGRTWEAHVAALEDSLRDPERAREDAHRFVASFIRPTGLDRPSVPQLAAAIARLAVQGNNRPAATTLPALALRGLLSIPVAAFHYGERTLNGRIQLPAVGWKRMRKQLRNAWRAARKQAVAFTRGVVPPRSVARRASKGSASGGRRWLSRVRSALARVPSRFERLLKRARYVVGTTRRSVLGEKRP
jgi:hypothetical protein